MSEETSLLTNNVFFIILNVAFLVIMLFFVSRTASDDIAYEQIYAKQISLLIDTARQNTDIDLDVSELYYKARENKYVPFITIENNIVNVKIKEGIGYSSIYFSDYNVQSALDKNNKKLLLKIT